MSIPYPTPVFASPTHPAGTDADCLPLASHSQWSPLSDHLQGRPVRGRSAGYTDLLWSTRRKRVCQSTRFQCLWPRSGLNACG
ncbi:hypothetical protein DPMN_070350 [Dreissena polymorpha]|uniref:Uncharacterized protein n=1 Tax=Dreissena polymorpha TaxID=45954 RepID=A0A9D4BV20_DREPO|nr:hypothetical protein DPMN_070350 [Dreissena polymorpha]